MRKHITELLRLGQIREELSPEQIHAYKSLLNGITLPLTTEETAALLRLFPESVPCGLKWEVMQLVETATGQLPDEEYLRLVQNCPSPEWRDYLLCCRKADQQARWRQEEQIAIRPASVNDLNELARLGRQLWPSHTEEDLLKEFGQILAEGGFFCLLLRQERSVGFAQCQLRRDYVEGAASSPVGYLEGIYVEPESRRRGLARLLLTYCEHWAREQGCLEFASDCELENDLSLNFHLAAGFREAGRIIHFIRRL